MNASVAVVIPVSGDGKYLLEAVRSALLPDDTSAEVVIVLNGASSELADELSALDGAVSRIVRIPRAIGAAAARNVGVKTTRAEWIRFLDSDDLFLPGSTSQLLTQIKDPKREIAIGRMRLVDEHGNLVRNLEIPAPAVGTVLLSRQLFDLVGMFDPVLKIGEFIDWFGRARILGIREVKTDQIVLSRRMHSRNSSAIGIINGNRDYLRVTRAHLKRSQ